MQVINASAWCVLRQEIRQPFGRFPLLPVTERPVTPTALVLQRSSIIHRASPSARVVWSMLLIQPTTGSVALRVMVPSRLWPAMEHRVCKTGLATRRVSMLHKALPLIAMGTSTAPIPVTPRFERLMAREQSALSLVTARLDQTILPGPVLMGWSALLSNDRISTYTWRTPVIIAFDVLMFPGP